MTNEVIEEMIVKELLWQRKLLIIALADTMPSFKDKRSAIASQIYTIDAKINPYLEVHK